MSELKKDELMVQLDYWGSECRKCAEHHNYSCETGCPYQERCEQVYKQIVALIKQPRPYEEFIEEKAKQLLAKLERSLVDEMSAKKTKEVKNGLTKKEPTLGG